MKYWVYILLSKRDQRLYVGCTTDVEKRLKRHNDGCVPATQYRTPLVCIYTEEFETKGDAFNRERFLKSLWSARFKNKLKKEYLSNIS